MKLDIIQDLDPINPREDDNVGTMVCWHTRYTLGDEQPKAAADYWFSTLWYDHQTEEELKERYMHWAAEMSIDELERAHSDYEEIRAIADEFELEHPTRTFPKKLLGIPLFLIDHSGLAINTTGFSCGWDSGQVGWIYADIKEALEKHGLRDAEHLKKCLVGEVETYNQYLQGDVWGYVITGEEGEELDSCWGFYGRDTCEEEGKRVLEYHQNKPPKQLTLF